MRGYVIRCTSVNYRRFPIAYVLSMGWVARIWSHVNWFLENNAIVYHIKINSKFYSIQFQFLARVLAKALKMLLWHLPTISPKFSTFSTFSISDEIIIEIYHQIFNFLISPKWIKIDQTWSNLISDEIIIQIYHQIFNFIYFLIRFNHICQNGSNWIKLDQNGSNLIK